MNVLILGSGGREHAFAKAISSSNLLNDLYTAPGNPGTAELGTNLDLDILNFDSVSAAALEHKVHMIIVGPEAPLVNGITDYFRSRKDLGHITIIGPGKKAAQLEGSKNFAKEFMNKQSIPTARHRTFNKNEHDQAVRFLEVLNPPYVLKADGLAGGKGVLIIDDLKEATDKLDTMFKGKFGEAGDKVVIEEYLDGIEVSVFVLTDGHSYKVLPEAKDYKRIHDGDKGPNTGGMGAVSPVPFMDGAMSLRIEERVIIPTMDGIRYNEFDYVGFIFIGLMIVDGSPYVIEYNVRMGDPETQAVLPRITSDLLAHLKSAGQGKLEHERVSFTTDTSVAVVAVSDGYPDAYEKGKSISNDFLSDDKVQFYHAGTKEENGKLVTSGGRVLAVTAMAENIKQAQKKAYAEMGKISFEGMSFRSDIGDDLS